MGSGTSKPLSAKDEGLLKWMKKIRSSVRSNDDGVLHALRSKKSTDVKGRAIHLFITARNIKQLDLHGE